jgi:hypothetical protein
MNESHAVSALRKIRAELSGELVELEKHRRALASKINHVDQTLKLLGFAGDPKDIPPRHKRGWIFRRGQLQQMVYGALREAEGPIKNVEIATHIIREMNWDVDDGELRALIAGKVKDVRKRMRRLGRVVTPLAANIPSTDD